MNNLAITYQHIADILSFETSNTQLEKTLSNPSFNWEAIVKEGSKHYVIPAIYCRLKTKHLLHLLPEDLINYLEFITNENRKRNEIILIQIHSISKLLNSQNIEHAFLKGSALLILGCFEDIAERMLGDIDLLVAPNQLKKAYKLLCDDGYSPSKQTLGNAFFEHKHLPRLETEITTTRIAAVEVHKKLFGSYKSDELNSKFIFEEKKSQAEVFIPSLKHLLMHNILNFQINDHGALYNSISIRSSYDTILLQREYIGAKKWYEEKMVKKYFKYNSLFFKDIKNVTNATPNIFTYFYLFKLKNIKFYKNWNILIKLSRFTPILCNRIWFFISNRAYRKAIIKNRSRIYADFKAVFE